MKKKERGQMNNVSNGVLFSDGLSQEIKECFYYVDNDPILGERLFFANAGGSFRLKKAVDAFARNDSIPDYPGFIHERARYLEKVQEDGLNDIRIILNATAGSILTTLTASQAMFDMVRAIAENVSGTNMVTSILEHPSAYDSMELYAEKLRKEFRVAKSNPVTGGVDVDELIKLVDKDTCLLSVMYASNISGAIYDIETIVKKARAIKPDLYIIVDAVQHTPHSVIDLQKIPVDGINFAPYKFFGCRGLGIAWLSERAAVLPHHKMTAKEANVWELGSPAISQFAVVTEIVNYVCWIGGKFINSNDRRELFAYGMEKIALHERALMARMLNGTDEIPGLRNIKGVKVFLDYEDLTKKDFIIAMGFENLGYKQAVQEYDKRGVVVYERLTSSPYSKRMLDSFKLDGALRIAPLHCHSIADIDKFLIATMELSRL
jgi:selenocysteine lyase/cysteine desulfurase